jgi:1-acyl-sn-glycerol-3-phosphate acyltransferase
MVMTVASPGDLGAYDPSYVREHAPWLGALVRTWFRAEVRGMERLPDGPFLGVGNHSGAAMIPDTLVWLDAYHNHPNAERATPLLLLAHDAMFDMYPASVARFFARFGGMRADRGLALRGLREGCAVQVYPGGDHDACRSFARRHEIVFAGRKGYVALAQEAGVPIVPVASVGAHEALVIFAEGRRLARWLGVDRSMRLTSFPISWSVPWGFWVGPLPGYLPLPTKIGIEVLAPIDPSGDVDEVDARVRRALQDAVDAMAEKRRYPIIG